MRYSICYCLNAFITKNKIFDRIVDLTKRIIIACFTTLKLLFIIKTFVQISSGKRWKFRNVVLNAFGFFFAWYYCLRKVHLSILVLPYILHITRRTIPPNKRPSSLSRLGACISKFICDLHVVFLYLEAYSMPKWS